MSEAVNRKEITAEELAIFLDCELEGDRSLLLTGVATIEQAQPNEVTFLANPRYRKDLASSMAGAVIIDAKEETPETMTRLVSKHPYIDFCRSLELFYPPQKMVSEGVSRLSVVHPSVLLGSGVRVGAFVVIEEDAIIGDDSILYPHSYVGRGSITGKDCIIGVGAVIRHNVRLGERVVVGDGSVIGFDGFGYAPTPGGYRKIPQVGKVVIEDDVEIGANSCIDRATIGETRIGRGTKIDNLIQIAHGVQIGENTVIAAQTGISGSTKIGSWVMVGGQVGMVGHIDIGDRMIIGAQAGVTKSVDIKGMISGYPARPQMESMRIEAALGQLPGLLKRVKALEAQVGREQSEEHKE